MARKTESVTKRFLMDENTLRYRAESTAIRNLSPWEQGRRLSDATSLPFETREYASRFGRSVDGSLQGE